MTVPEGNMKKTDKQLGMHPQSLKFKAVEDASQVWDLLAMGLCLCSLLV